MATGDIVTQKFLLVSENPEIDSAVPDVGENVLAKCCFCVPVFADVPGTNDFQNDKSAFLFIHAAGVSVGKIFLQKSAGGTFTDLLELVDDTFGELFPFGFQLADGNKYMGFRIDWNTILPIHGIGFYRLRSESTSITGTFNEFSFGHELKIYSKIEADNSVRLEFYNNRVIGDFLNLERKKNFVKLDWFNQMRIPRAIITSPESEYDTENVRYEDGTLRDIKNEQTEIFDLSFTALPNFIHDFIKTEIFQSDRIFITDYNSQNALCDVVDMSVKLNSSYAPEKTSQEPGVELTLIRGINNARKLFC